MRIACLGTSANPPHLGHLNVARQILKNKLADEIWLIVCWQHSFGKFLMPWKHRWKMAKMLEQKGIKACDIERQRKNKSYTIDTVKALKKKYPQHKFYWAIGSDLIASGEYKKWESWPQLKKEIQFLLIKRPGYSWAEAREKCFIKTKIRGSNISSTLIRERLKKSLNIDSLVTAEIAQYLKKHNLI